MKNKKGPSKISVLIKRILNVRAWIDWDRVKSGGKYIAGAAKGVFVHSSQRTSESFDEAKARLHLTDEVMQSRERALLRNAYLMLGLGVFLFLYSIYHLVFGTLHAALFSFALTAVSLSFAFRYHFWYYQIKSKKLGCTIREWFRQGLMGDKS